MGLAGILLLVGVIDDLRSFNSSLGLTCVPVFSTTVTKAKLVVAVKSYIPAIFRCQHPDHYGVEILQIQPSARAEEKTTTLRV
ncbi:hypothetical protein BD779DRAFT_1529485 [Infundibulicybe gibba]|nr:hypothetical protein BD779DRAFT_1529485 [Infundibulicybe gibba]